jgi:TolB protein
MLQLQARRLIVLALLCAAAVAVTGVDARAQGGVVIDITKPQRTKYPIAIPTAADGDSATAAEIARIASFNLSIAGWFRVLEPKSFLADLRREGLNIEPPKWKDVGAFGVIKYRAQKSGNNLVLEFRLYEVEKGASAVLTRTYRGSAGDVRRFTHMWSNEVVKYFTGEDGFFGSKIVFTARHRTGDRRWSSIMAMDFDGHAPYSVSRVRYINILPAISRDGSRVAFTSYMRDNPDLYVVGIGGGRPQRLSFHRGMNTGASWSPDGSQIALTLSRDGRPEVYVINAQSGAIVRRLTNTRAIDTSPAWSPDGREIAFVSDREGGPQIFVMPASGGAARRVSFTGGYNTTPAWSPQKGARVLAYTTRGEGGNFDIVTINLETNKMTRITQGEGNNEEPSFSPNGRAIAFARAGRNPGIYIANADGTGDAVRVFSGSVTSVSWGPPPRQ